MRWAAGGAAVGLIFGLEVGVAVDLLFGGSTEYMAPWCGAAAAALIFGPIGAIAGMVVGLLLRKPTRRRSDPPD